MGGRDPLELLEEAIDTVWEGFFAPPRRRLEDRAPPAARKGLFAPAAVSRLLGLEVRHAWVEGGLVDGREASWRVAEGSRFAYLLLQIVVPLRRELPEGLRVKDRRRDIGGLALGLPSDDLIEVACEDPEDAARILGAEAVHEAVVDLIGGKKEDRPVHHLLLTGAELRATVFRSKRTAAQAAEAVRACVRLADAVDEALLSEWRSLEERGLSFDGDVAMSGVLDEVRLWLRYHEEGVERTSVIALIEPPLPPETVLGHPRLHRDDHDLDDPILDGQLAVRTSDLEALRSRLRRDAVRGALLELVHQHPGSVVLADQVHLVVPGLEVRPARLVQLVSELAEGLRGL